MAENRRKCEMSPKLREQSYETVSSARVYMTNHERYLQNKSMKRELPEYEKTSEIYSSADCTAYPVL